MAKKNKEARQEHLNTTVVNTMAKEHSLATRLNRNFFLRYFFALLGFDFLIFILSFGAYFYYTEKSLLGEHWHSLYSRKLVYQIPENHVISSFYEKLGFLEYQINLGGGEILKIHVGDFIRIFAICFTILLVFQFISLIRDYIRGRRENVEILKEPLEEMARQAEQLSKVRIDEERYHDLEDAIVSLTPGRPGMQVHTGDPSLADVEEAINDLLSQTHDSYQQQTRFVSDASHELRTPISVIQGYADMLARWGTEDEEILHESIDAIRSETKQMQILVEQLLFLARGDSGRNQMTKENFNLSQMLQEVFEEYQMINPDYIWEVNSEEEIPIRGDSKMLKQTLRILVNNAIRYSEPQSKVILSAGWESANKAFFAVQDMGCGIAIEDVPHIFERFYRSDPARKREGGTGLGLSIAKWIVDEHDGHFKVLSREGLGTRITVVLPQNQSEIKYFQEKNI